jgi:hypothetical protein
MGAENATANDEGSAQGRSRYCVAVNEEAQAVLAELAEVRKARQEILARLQEVRNRQGQLTQEYWRLVRAVGTGHPQGLDARDPQVRQATPG